MADQKLAGEIAVITGSDSGIGQATAIAPSHPFRGSAFEARIRNAIASDLIEISYSSDIKPIPDWRLMELNLLR